LRIAAPATLALVIGVLVGVDVRLGALLTLLLVAPVLVWARPAVALGFLCLCLGINVDVMTVPVFVSLPQFMGMALIAAVLLRPRNEATSDALGGLPGGLLPNGQAMGDRQATRGTPGRRALWMLGGFLLLLACLPSLPGAVSNRAALSGMLQLMAVASVLYAGGRWFARSPDLVDRALALLVLGGIISVCVAVVQVVFDIGPASFRTAGVMRAYSTYGQPNSYGMFLVGVTPLALVLRKHTHFAAPAFLALLAGIALTGSRGAWIALLAGLLTMGALLARPRLSTVLKGAAVLAIVPLMLFLVPREFLLSRFDFNDWSTQQRLLLLFTAWQGILQSPITGYGPGSFEHVLEAIAPAALVDDVTMPHNMILHVWFELGLLAVLAFTVLIGLYYVAAIRSYLKTRDLRTAGLVAGVTAMLVGSMFGSLFIRGIEELFVVLIALTGALSSPAFRSAARPEVRDAPAAPL